MRRFPVKWVLDVVADDRHGNAADKVLVADRIFQQLRRRTVQRQQAVCNLLNDQQCRLVVLREEAFTDLSARAAIVVARTFHAVGQQVTSSCNLIRCPERSLAQPLRVRFGFAGAFRPAPRISRNPRITSSTSSSGKSRISLSSRRSTGRKVGLLGAADVVCSRSPGFTPRAAARRITRSVEGVSLPRSIRDIDSAAMPVASAKSACLIPARFRKPRTRVPMAGDFRGFGMAMRLAAGGEVLKDLLDHVKSLDLI